MRMSDQAWIPVTHVPHARAAQDRRGSERLDGSCAGAVRQMPAHLDELRRAGRAVIED
jgi:hypothetical protein